MTAADHVIRRFLWATKHLKHLKNERFFLISILKKAANHLEIKKRLGRDQILRVPILCFPYSYLVDAPTGIFFDS